LRAAGFQVERIEPPEGFSNLASDVALVMDYEGSRTNRQLWQTHGEAIGKKLAQLVARGLKLTQLQNKEALGRIREVRRRMAKAFAATPVLLTPAALGPAPHGLESTGSPVLNAPWTGLGVPTVTIPMADHRGLPLGLQMTSDRSNEALLRTAVAVEGVL
ncbi:MAG: hypothetical protein GY953_04400, partial [bacterium]|nr:hypothetical protein [bacterium]